MSAKVESKKFGKATRSVPHHSEKAQKWYPAEDVAQPRKVRFGGLLEDVLRHKETESWAIVELKIGGGDDSEGQVALVVTKQPPDKIDCSFKNMATHAGYDAQ